MKNSNANRCIDAEKYAARSRDGKPSKALCVSRRTANRIYLQYIYVDTKKKKIQL